MRTSRKIHFSVSYRGEVQKLAARNQGGEKQTNSFRLVGTKGLARR